MGLTISDTARALVRARVQAQFDTPVSILRGGLGALDATTGRVGGLSAAQTVWSGNARIHTVTGEGSVSLGEGNIAQRQTVISIPWNAPVPQRDDVVVVSTSSEDTDLDGEAFRVVGVAGGTAFADARRLSCTAWGRSRFWSGAGA